MPSTILQVIPNLDTGGAELSALEINEAIIQAGGRSIIATQGGLLEPTARKQGAEIFNISVASKNPLLIIKNSIELARFVKRERVSLIHARSRAPAWSAFWAARYARLPFVTTYHGAYNENGPIKRLYNGVMARGDVVIANSKFTAQLIKQRYGTPNYKIKVIYRGVDNKFSPSQISEKRKLELRSSWGVKSGQRIILQAARLTAWKGHKTLIKAAEILYKAGQLDDVVFILAGDSQGRISYRQDLQKLISHAGLKDHVRLVGHVSDIEVAFNEAYLNVISSIEPEAFGRTSVEAQALGCPVIATRLGAPQETVLAEPEVSRSDRTGWLVEAGDAEELASTIKEALILSYQQRCDIGRRAILNVQTRFSLEKMKQQTLDVYERLLNNNLVTSDNNVSQF
ncbi:MAG: D-inositol 3-phosphate glycosyltransferase [Hyphomicrobiaceae bacterium hypho_1]